jgi:hypothetical protein
MKRQKTKDKRQKTLFSLPSVSRPVPATKWMGMESSFASGTQAAPKGKPRGRPALAVIGQNDKEKATHASPLPGRIVKDAQG